MDRAVEWGDRIPIGLFYKNPSPRASLDRVDPGLESGPLVSRPLGLDREARQKLIAEFM
jgi:hypothetical protein